jgi:hypothetical protein
VAGEPSRWPATIGVLAMVVGAVLMALSAGNDPPRPRVLGEMLVATTTTVPVRETADTDAPSTSRATTPRRVTSTTRPAASGGAATTSTTEAPPSTSSSTSPPPTSPATSTPTTQPCPSGAPVAQVRTWDGGSGGGAWHVTVSGVVTNRTGAAARVGPVAVTIERADGDTYVIPADERPTPDPSTVADGGEATWRWEGDVPAGTAPVGARAAVTEWTWVDAPPGCITG